jgi:uncharacterized membrane protein YhhN
MTEWWGYALLAVPAALAVLAVKTGFLPFKVGVPAACGLILIVHAVQRAPGGWQSAWLVAAFVCSMAGDAFLSNKGGRESYFVTGIGAYLFAHVGYLVYALLNGRLHGLALGLLLAGYLAYYVLVLRPAIDAPVLSLAVLIYLVISCVTLAAAVGMRLPPWVKACYVAGIALIVLSDTLISFNEFLHDRTFNAWILPTYDLAQISITLSVLLLRR